MRYNGTFLSNFDGASKTNDVEFQRDLILDQISIMIKKHPDIFTQVLNDSKIRVPEKATKKQLADLAIEGLYHNREFRKNITLAIVEMNVE